MLIRVFIGLTAPAPCPEQFPNCGADYLWIARDLTGAWRETTLWSSLVVQSLSGNASTTRLPEHQMEIKVTKGKKSTHLVQLVRM